MGNYTDFSEISGLFQKPQFWAPEGTYFVTLALNLFLTLSIQNIHSNQLIFNVPVKSPLPTGGTPVLLII